MQINVEQILIFGNKVNLVFGWIYQQYHFVFEEF